VKALEMFKRGQITALVATEVAARGLDIKELPQVVNYELPNVPEDYVHRIGRTGRAGALGQAVSLVSSDENGLLRDIERVLKRAIPVLPTPAFETAPDAHPASERPANAHSGSPGGSRRSNSGQAPARSSAAHGGNSRGGERRDTRQHWNADSRQARSQRQRSR
jgi:ATP-dependent RNA helicase RhlE